MDVISACCFCLILLFILFFYSTESYALEAIFLFVHCFWKLLEKKTEILSVVQLVDIYAKNWDERGPNFMCERTLPSILVFFYIRIQNFNHKLLTFWYPPSHQVVISSRLLISLIIHSLVFSVLSFSNFLQSFHWTNSAYCQAMLS